MIDTHTHIYLAEFDEDRTLVMQRAQEQGIDTLLLPAIDSSTHAAMLAVESAFPACRAMIGLHPCSVKADFEQELAIIRTHLSQRSFVAIGEIGLDFYWDKTFVTEQLQAFHAQIRLALDHNLPISIHSREAIDEAIDVVRRYPGLRGVFHCFSGTLQQAQNIMDTGFFLGIGGVVTFKKSGLDAVLSQTGLDRVVLETDAPYLAPVPYRGKRNEPSYTRLVAAHIAGACSQSLERVEEITTENARKLFGL